jgi:hypothetical protein
VTTFEDDNDVLLFVLLFAFDDNDEELELVLLGDNLNVVTSCEPPVGDVTLTAIGRFVSSAPFGAVFASSVVGELNGFVAGLCSCLESPLLVLLLLALLLGLLAVEFELEFEMIIFSVFVKFWLTFVTDWCLLKVLKMSKSFSRVRCCEF